MQTIMSFDAHTGPVAPHWPGLAERIIERVFSGQTIPKDPTQQ